MEEATATTRETRTRAAWAAGAAALVVSFVALLWPAPADAQTRPLRPKCESPERTLNVVASGGTATFTATEPIYGCIRGSSPTFYVKQTCTFHCQHWHTWVPTGKPLPANVRVSATPTDGTFLVGWSWDNCTPRLGQPRSDCTVRVSTTGMTVTAYLSSVRDETDPTPPALGAAAPGSYSAVLSWSPSSDNHAVAGYDVFRNDVLVARVGRGATSAKVANLSCQTTYSFRVEAFDASQNAATSAAMPVTTGKCGPTRPPNTILHVGPPRTTKARSAYFHWGANRTPVRYQCKLDRGRWTSCRPGKRYRNLRKGYHTFQVRARDAGGVDPTPAKRRWRIV